MTKEERRDKLVKWLEESEKNMVCMREVVSDWSKWMRLGGSGSISKTWEYLSYLINSMVQSENIIDYIKNYDTLGRIQKKAIDFITNAFYPRFAEG